MCGLEFDRKDIEMNKLVATCLESKFHVFDMRTEHPKKGYASVYEKVILFLLVFGCTVAVITIFETFLLICHVVKCPLGIWHLHNQQSCLDWIVCVE